MNRNNLGVIAPDHRTIEGTFTGTIWSIMALLLSVSYGVIWGSFFLVYSSRDVYPKTCQTLIKWDQAIYILYFISVSLHLVSTLIQFIVNTRDRESPIPKFITAFRSCLSYLAGMAILIGLTLEYASLEEPEKCGDLAKINMIYIILEWTILLTCVLFVYVVCIVSIFMKKRKRSF
jgi:hypothetical protein